MTIGILDWGIGGCGFYDLLRQKSAVPIVYLSDSGYTPYGKVPKEELVTRVEKCIRFLKDKGASHIVIACNAAGSVVQTDENIVNVIQYALKIVKHSDYDKIGIIGGKRTIESGIFESNNSHVLNVAQKLSAHIEAGNLSGEKLENDVREILTPLENVQALLLACTHYPAIKSVFRKYLHDSCVLLDPAEHMLHYIEENWDINDYDVKANQWFTTGDINQTKRAAQLAFNVHISQINKIGI